MLKVLICLLAIITTLNLEAQKGIVRYEYKILYDRKSPKDSSIMLIGKNFYDSKMNEIKTIVYGPEKTDTCWAYKWYDRHGNILKTTSKCTDSKITKLNEYYYEYDKNGKIIRSKYIQYDPFFQIIVTKRSKDSIVEKVFTSKEDMKANLFSKHVSFLDKFGKITSEFNVNEQGDTNIFTSILYLPLSDTAVFRANPDKPKNVDKVIYLNADRKEEATDYYEKGKLTDHSTKQYGPHGKIVLERYTNDLTKMVIKETTYSYDAKGLLLEKRNKNFRDDLTSVSYFHNELLIREDFYYGNFLDHSILYKYKDK